MEQVRVNAGHGQPVPVAEQDLQDKSNRYYFSKANLLNQDEVYLTPLDLNVERGKVEEPFKPTIRISVPLFNRSGQHIGVLVINYLADNLLQQFAETPGGSGGNIMLLNEQGYWLYHPEEKMRWGFMFGKETTLAQTMPEEWQSLAEQDTPQWHSGRGLFTQQQVEIAGTALALEAGVSQVILGEGYPWTVVSWIPGEKLGLIKRNIATRLGFTAAPILLFLLIALFFFSRHRELQIQQQAYIAESELRKRSILDSVGEGILTVDDSDRIIEANPFAERMFSLADGQLLNRFLGDLIRLDDHHSLSAMPAQQSSSEVHSETTEGMAMPPEGELFPVEITLSPLWLNGKRFRTVLLRDLTEKRTAEKDLALAGSVFETAAEGICVTDEQQIIQRVNPSFCLLTGYSESELIGRTTSILRSSKTSDALYQRMWTELEHTGRWRGEIWNRRKNGEIRAFDLSIFVIRNKQGEIVQYGAVSRDITEEKQAEEEVYRHAYYDSLTQLPNRMLFLERLQQAIDGGSRYREHFTLFFLDLDRFKAVNDTLGHEAGDRLLKQVAERVSGVIRKSDTLARLAGDEFCVLLNNSESSDAIASLAQKVISALNRPFDVGGREANISASIGICQYPEDGTDADELLRHADLAMYQAKRSPTEQYHFFSKEMNAVIERRVRLESDLQQAIRQQQLALHYQPLIDYREGKLVGAEALLRWKHPSRGKVSPGEFIPLAEESGLIRPLSEWVISTAAAQLVSWQTTLNVPINISVNLSAYRKRHAVERSFIEEVLRETGAPPSRLIFEITEGLIMENTDDSLAWIKFMKELGIGVAIDDFGTGYSSLSYLKRFPVDILKIDRSFIADMTYDSEDEALVLAIIAMAKSLNLKVVAEGVENLEQVELLSTRQSHCSVLQGFLFSPALPPDQFVEFVRNFEVGRYLKKTVSGVVA